MKPSRNRHDPVSNDRGPKGPVDLLGKDLSTALQCEGFKIARSSQSYVWLERGEDLLLVDIDSEIKEDIAQQLLERARRSPTPPPEKA